MSDFKTKIPERKVPAKAKKWYLCRYAANGAECPEFKGHACDYPACGHTEIAENARECHGERQFMEFYPGEYFEVL